VRHAAFRWRRQGVVPLEQNYAREHRLVRAVLERPSESAFDRDQLDRLQRYLRERGVKPEQARAFVDAETLTVHYRSNRRKLRHLAGRLRGHGRSGHPGWQFSTHTSKLRDFRATVDTPAP
jgi:hypothetical protein